MIEEGKKGVGGGVDGFVVRAWVPIERVVIAVMAAARAHTAPPRRGKEVFWSSGLLLLLLCRDPPSLVGLMTGSSVIESASRCSFCFSFLFPSFSFYSSWIYNYKRYDGFIYIRQCNVFARLRGVVFYTRMMSSFHCVIINVERVQKTFFR